MSSMKALMLHLARKTHQTSATSATNVRMAQKNHACCEPYSVGHLNCIQMAEPRTPTTRLDTVPTTAAKSTKFIAIGNL
jgi:hypothetical protein